MTDTTDTTGTAAALTRLLLGPDAVRVHAPWQRLVARPAFRRGPEEPRQQRLRRAYTRLRMVEEVPGGGVELAADVRRLVALHEWLSPVDTALATIAGIHYNLFLGTLLDHGGRRVRDLAPYASMRQVGTFLCTEVGHGNDAAALETTATWDPARDGFVLHTPNAAAQKFMPNASTTGGPKTGLVAARLLAGGADHGPFLFVVPLTSRSGTLPGVRVRELPQRLGSVVDHCVISFDRVHVPRGALLEGRQGTLAADGSLVGDVPGRRQRFFTAIGRVTVGRMCLSACAVGGARTALAAAVRYAHHRHITGVRAGRQVPVFAHRGHHAPLVRALATTYAMTLLHRRVVDGWLARGHGPADAAAERQVALAKAWITWQARGVLTECRERCGAAGLLADNGIGDLMNAVEGAITAEGDNLAVSTKAAAELVSAAAPARPAPPPAPGADLHDARVLHGLLAAVESLWRERARDRMATVPAGDPLRRWNAGATAALTAADACACREAAEALDDASARAGHPRAAELLRELLRLFAWRQIARHSGDLLARGHLTAEQVESLPALDDELTAALAPHALTLARAFAVPRELLEDIPLARTDYLAAYDDPKGPWHRPDSLDPAGSAA